jgi:hypothetical protein
MRHTLRRHRYTESKQATLRIAVAVTLAFLTLRPAVSQETPIATSAQQLPDTCTVTCRLRVNGDLAIADKASTQRLLESYDAALAANAPTQQSGLAYEYGAQLLEGSTAESNPLVSGVSKVVVHAMEEHGKQLKASYDEAVTKQLLIEANKEIDAHAIDPATGRVNVDALRKNGALDWLTSDDFYAHLDPAHREALDQARGNVQIDALVSVASTVQITQDEVQHNGERLNALNNAVQTTQGFVVGVGALVEKERTAIDTLTADTKSNSDRMQKIMLAQLPPRQKLALVAQGVIQISDEEQTSLQDSLEAQDITHDADQASHAMRSLATIVGPGPFATDLQHLAQVAQLGAGIYASYLTGNAAGMVNGTLDLVGAVSAFGGGAPSAESQMLKAVLAKLDEIDHKLDQYHQQEMQELDAIHQDLNSMRVELLAKISQLEIEQWDALRYLRQVDTKSVKPCEDGKTAFDNRFQGLDTWSLKEFDNWLTPQHARDWYGRCAEGLSAEWDPWGADASGANVSMLFVPATDAGPTASPDVEQELDKAHETLQELVAPMIAYLAKYQLWGQDRRAYFRVPAGSFDALDRIALKDPQEPQYRAAAASAASLITDAGGHSFIDASTVLTLSRESRTILEWTPTSRVTDAGFRAATLNDLHLCARRSDACHLADWRDSLKILQNDERVLHWLVEQEQLIAGLPAVVFAAGVLESQIIGKYDDARAGLTDGKDLQRLLTRSCTGTETACSAIPTGYSAARAACSSNEKNTEARDTLCLMEANPIFADNVIGYLAWHRVKGRGTTWQYIVGTGWDTPDILQAAVGAGIRLFDASTAAVPTGPAPPDEREWSIELPRVFTEVVDPQTGKVVTRAQDTTQPRSCWDDRDRLPGDAGKNLGKFPETKWWLDELRVGDSTIVESPYWARCYLLPSWKNLRAQRLERRDGFAEITAELDAVVKAQGELTPQSRTTGGVAAARTH